MTITFFFVKNSKKNIYFSLLSAHVADADVGSFADENWNFSLVRILVHTFIFDRNISIW
jgi:hypothetical protein